MSIFTAERNNGKFPQHSKIASTLWQKSTEQLAVMMELFLGERQGRLPEAVGFLARGRARIPFLLFPDDDTEAQVDRVQMNRSGGKSLHNWILSKNCSFCQNDLQ